MEQSLADAGLAAERGRRVSAGPRAAAARHNGAAREARIDAELRRRRHRARRSQLVPPGPSSPGRGPAVNDIALVAGLVTAVVGAIRSTWSP